MLRSKIYDYIGFDSIQVIKKQVTPIQLSCSTAKKSLVLSQWKEQNE